MQHFIRPPAASRPPDCNSLFATPSLSRKQIVRLVREVAADLGGGLTRRRFLCETGLDPEVIDRMFGGWRGLLHAVARASHRKRGDAGREDRRGCESRDPSAVGRDQLLQFVRKMSADHGAEFTQNEFCRRFGISPSYIIRQFGSWRNLRELAGVPIVVRRHQRYTNQELMDDLLRVYLLTGVRPSSTQHRLRGGTIPPLTIKQRFGTWKIVRIAFEIYRQIYFLSHDRQWSRDAHELSFRPGRHHQLHWPPGHPITPNWHPLDDMPKEFEG
jgi:hypothetical protein